MNNATAILAIVFLVSVAVMFGALIAGAPRWNLLSQNVEDTVSTAAMWTALISAPLLAVLVLVRALL